jgi:hypothetical protein
MNTEFVCDASKTFIEQQSPGTSTIGALANVVQGTWLWSKRLHWVARTVLIPVVFCCVCTQPMTAAAVLGPALHFGIFETSLAAQSLRLATVWIACPPTLLGY